MSSGVAVNPECQSTFQKMAEGKKEFRYIIYKIEDKEVVVEKAVSPADLPQEIRDNDDYADNSKLAYDHFYNEVKTLTEGWNDCRFACFDFKFTSSREGAGTSKMDKIIFLQICPDGSSIKRKMVYASSASAIKSALGTGKLISLQVSDESEMDHKELVKKLADKYSDK